MSEVSNFKNVAFIIQLPMILAGFVVGTIWYGFKQSFILAMEWWDD